MKYHQYLGIILGAAYGYICRLIYASDFFSRMYDDLDIYSISFFWIVPIVISILPILFAREEVLESDWKKFGFPVLSVLLFFLFALSSGIEDWLCILIIAFPFLLCAGIVGMLIAPIIKKRNSKKLYSIILLPFIFCPVESLIPNKVEQFTVASKVIVAKDKATVWSNLIEVPEIKSAEYEKGFFNYIGVPRPIKSELKTIDGTEYRIGYFSDDLKLYETIANIQPLKFVEFTIHIDKSELRDLPTDNHLLQSDYFSFDNISYELKEIEPYKTELILSCSYTLNSNMNGYANFWADKLLEDFEVRLLNSLKLKIESD
ncbi:MAG: hypothetical protein P1U56_19070 [Saprospiraceae bacterium]|nr:hypothetical protein [Saprospiraceae bacterium]